MKYLKKWIVITLILNLAGTAAIPVRPVYAGDPKLSDQITGDLIGAGISIAIAMTGNLPLALVAGYLTKYINTYGISGIRSLIDHFKGHQPQDLGEINLYYVYLLNVKRNLYSSLIEIRKAAEEDHSLSYLVSQIDDVEKSLSAECKPGEGCNTGSVDYAKVNFQLLDMLVDARQSVNVSKYLDAQDLKATYQYLILLYLDVVIVEQKLIEAQYNVMVSTTMGAIQDIKANPYLSQAEKEHRVQLLYNMSLRWMYLADTRRVLVAKAIEAPLQNIRKENEQLEDEINKYRPKKPAEALQ